MACRSTIPREIAAEDSEIELVHDQQSDDDVFNARDSWYYTHGAAIWLTRHEGYYCSIARNVACRSARSRPVVKPTSPREVVRLPSPS